MKHFCYILSLFAFLIFLVSCSEKNEAGEYDNWKERNQHYVDSIASLADAGTDGWTKLLAYKYLEPADGSGGKKNHYVYIQKLASGSGKEYPKYNDSIRVHYLGRLIPSASYEQGFVFGKSYSSYVLDDKTDVPALMGVNNTVIGYATAVMNMVEGDRWKIVIPYSIGYGSGSNSSKTIPAYSTLIFDLQLARIYRYMIDTDTTWH